MRLKGKTPRKKLERMSKVNAAHCKECGSYIISLHRHDFRECKCGSIFVDGGFDYFRWGGKEEAFERIEFYDAPKRQDA